MNDLERFQAEHGAAWAAITQTPAFIAAFTLSNIEKLQGIAALSDDEIATHGQVILADLRGHLSYETALITLHQEKKLVFQDLGPATYPNPEEEIETDKPEREPPNHVPSEFQVQPEPREKPKRRRHKRRKKPQ